MSIATAVPGCRLALLLRRKSGDAFTPSDYRVQITLDSPPGLSGTVRLNKVYNPAGGSDTGASADGDNVLFEFSPEETAPMAAYPGSWSAVVAIGPAATQDPLIPRVWRSILVYAPSGGAVPYGD
jgi:hypothetical protein